MMVRDQLESQRFHRKRDKSSRERLISQSRVEDEIGAEQ